MRWGSTKGLFPVALVLTLGMALERAQVPPPRFAPQEYTYPPTPAATPRLQRDFIGAEGGPPSVHSPTLAELGDGNLLAAWFGGSREGARDVALYGARWSAEGGWGPATLILDRRQAERDLGRSLRKLGNPVLARDAGGRLWLFFVTTSLGGWSTSSIAYRTSLDEGRHWSPARQLITSPFLNLSTLARARPLLYADGGLALPAYHELVGKFGELLRLDADGRVLAKSRLSAGRSGIQPSLVATGPRRAWAFLRQGGAGPPRVLVTRSQDAGNTWAPWRPSPLPNPNASVAALLGGQGDLLLVYNDCADGRGSLALARSRDGHQWQRLLSLEQGTDRDEFSYPFLIRARDGRYHLVYTWQRRRIAHAWFNEAWLEQQGPEQGR